MSAPGATSTVLHGVFVELFDVGVLITGPSGVGKSELALELLSRGHRLVADDAVICRLGPGDGLIGECPELLKGFLEVRGLGVVNVERIYGQHSVVGARAMELVIELGAPDTIGTPEERVGGRRRLCRVLGRDLHSIALRAGPQHHPAALAEAAARDHRLRCTGYDATADFAQRQVAKAARR